MTQAQIDKCNVARRAWARRNPEKCKAARTNWRNNHREKFNASRRQAHLRRAPYLRHRYNISLDEYQCILDEQGGMCAGCKRFPHVIGKTRLHVDHDHSPPYLIRGLLCFRCNQMIPNLRNVKERFFNLLKYLNAPPAVTALGERFANPAKRRGKK